MAQADSKEVTTAITGGSFTGSRSGIYIDASNSTYMGNLTEYSVTIANGQNTSPTFNGTISAIYTKETGLGDKKIMSVSGGKFSDDVSQYTSPNYDELATNNGTPTPYIAGRYSDSGAQVAMNTTAAKVTVDGNVDIYFASLQDAVTKAEEEILNNSTAVITLRGNTDEAVTVNSPLVIQKNGFAAPNLTAGTGLTKAETDSSYSFYTTPAPPAGGTQYTVAYSLEQLDGTEAVQGSDTKTGLSADEATKAFAKTYPGFTMKGASFDSTANTYTVHYVRNLYTVSFTSEGTAVESTNYKYGETAATPAAPARTGYTFTGWAAPGQSLAVGDTFEITQNMEFTAQWKATGTPGGSSNSSNSSHSASHVTSHDDDNDEFWANVKDKIKGAEFGDVIKVNARSYDKMPRSVMKALWRNPGVSLVISWRGGNTITIPAGQAQSASSSRVYYPLSQLEKLYQNAQLNAPSSGKPNPATSVPGSILEVIPAAAGAVSQLPVLPALAFPLAVLSAAAVSSRFSRKKQDM